MSKIGEGTGAQRPSSASRRPRVLILPGISNSGPSHWQSLWEAGAANFERVIAPDWEHPVCADWVAALQSTLASTDDPVVLIAHSVGCLQVVHWAAQGHHRPVRGALLVAPPDPESPEFPPQASGFAPLPEKALDFPSILVASSDDRFATLDFSRRCAARWHSEFVAVGPRGHINAESGVHDWPEGRIHLERLLK